MAGIPHGCVDMYFDSGIGFGASTDFRIAQNAFKNIYEVMMAHPSASIVSLYYGQSAPNGTGYFGEPNPFTNGAFFVVKMPANAGRDFDYYWLCQYAHVAVTGSGSPSTWIGTANNPGTPAIGFSLCAVSGSSANPWNGGLVASGSDAKGTPVWNVSPGTALVLPASNNPGGTHATNRDNLAFISTFTRKTRTHFACDDDHVIAMNSNAVFDYSGRNIFFGPYEKSGALSGSNCLVMHCNTGGNVTLTVPNNIPDTRGGLIVAVTGSNYAFTLAYDIANTMNYSRNMYGKFMEVGLELFSNTVNNRGYAGRYGLNDDFFSLMVGPNGSVNHNRSKAYFGYSENFALRFGIPWDGVTSPGMSFSRTGSFF